MNHIEHPFHNRPATAHGRQLFAANDLPATPRHIVEKAMARHAIGRAQRVRDNLLFWTHLNYAEALLRSAIRGHLRRAR